jgi:hypothetical protein
MFNQTRSCGKTPPYPNPNNNLTCGPDYLVANLGSPAAMIWVGRAEMPEQLIRRRREPLLVIITDTLFVVVVFLMLREQVNQREKP